MKLYVAKASPYARMALVVISEKSLEEDVEVEAVEAQLRVANSAFYEINPSGRVPYLVRDDGVGMEESALICAYLDQVGGNPALEVPAEHQWELRRLEAVARSALDGLAVWSRELRRSENRQSPSLLRHETARFERLADFWEQEADHPLLRGQLNLAQITLACALGFDVSIPGLAWRATRPRLAEWHARVSARPSFIRNANPPTLPRGIGHTWERRP